MSRYKWLKWLHIETPPHSKSIFCSFFGEDMDEIFRGDVFESEEMKGIHFYKRN